MTELPRTGPADGAAVLVPAGAGVALVAAGAALLIAMRRRRDRRAA